MLCCASCCLLSTRPQTIPDVRLNELKRYNIKVSKAKRMHAVHVQLVSPSANLQIKRKRAQLTGSDQVIHFEMVPTAFSSSVRVLAMTPDQPAELGILGKGASGAVL